MGCKMTVYLDNIRIVGRLGGVDDYVNELAQATHMAAMEIYPRAVAAVSVVERHVWCGADLDE
jgi:hypothetical protein